MNNLSDELSAKPQRSVRCFTLRWCTEYSIRMICTREKGAAALDSSVEAQGKTNAKKPHRVLEGLNAAFMYEMGDGGFEPPTPTMST